MSYVTHATCILCGKKYGYGSFQYVCDDHGNEGILDIHYDYESIRNNFTKEMVARSTERGILRYRPLLPIGEGSAGPGLDIGLTPLVEGCNLAGRYGVSRLYIKDDGRLPTASFKDRASAIAVIRAMEEGAEVITTASTGNAAAALSGLCASVQQPNVIFVPATAPQAKIAQLLMFGARVILVDGTYDEAFELCLQVAAEKGWYNRNTGFNPYMTEGKKTCSFEICEQLGWEVPDAVVVSVGDGCIIGGLHKGFSDLYALGWIERIPKLYGIQAQGSCYLEEAWRKREDLLTKPACPAVSVADSICAGLPRDRFKAMRAVVESGGAFIAVSDDEILKAAAELAANTGIFAEPAGAAAWAGLKKGLTTQAIEAEQTIVMVNTGSGLKDIPAAMKAVEKCGLPLFTVAPGIEAFRRIEGKLQLT